MFTGMGDSAEVLANGALATRGLRIVQGMSEREARVVFTCWAQLWVGTLRVGRDLHQLEANFDGDVANWRVTTYVTKSCAV